MGKSKKESLVVDRESQKSQIFVCTHERKNDACCAQSDGFEILKALKEWSKSEPDLKKKMRITRSGCLDRCKEGAVIAIYPNNVWITHASLDQLDEIKMVIEGELD